MTLFGWMMASRTSHVTKIYPDKSYSQYKDICNVKWELGYYFFSLTAFSKNYQNQTFLKKKRHQCRHDCHLTQHSKHAENHRVKHYKAWGIMHFYIFGFLHNAIKLVGRLEPPPSSPPPPLPLLCLFAKFPHQEIRWNFGILRGYHSESN